VRWGWGLWVDGRQVWRSLATAPSESDERGREVGRALVKCGLQPPVTCTTAGAPGLRKAVEGWGPAPGGGAAGATRCSP
jgi:hypothetical protein